MPSTQNDRRRPIAMEIPNCQRCGLLIPDKPVRLYIALAQETNSVGHLPLEPLRLTGGFLNVCGDCYGEWLAATKTWFELTRKHVDRIDAAGIQ